MTGKSPAALPRAPKGALVAATSMGGVLPIEHLAERPIYAAKSGPSLAPIAARLYAEAEFGSPDAVVCDTGGGPWLFGEYSIADAMYAPVVLRFNTYGAQISETARWYAATALEDAALQSWVRAAQDEPWIIRTSEVG